MDRKLSHIEIKNTVSVDYFPGISVVIPDGVNFIPGILGHIRDLFEDLFSIQRQVPPGNIQAGKQQVGSAGGLGQVDDLAHIAGIHVFACQQQGALGQAAAGFVHGDRGHIRSRPHGGKGHIFPKIKMGAVGLIRQHQHIVPVGKLRDGPQVGAHPVIGRIIHQHRLGGRVF